MFTPVERRERRLSGIPTPRTGSGGQRIFRHPWGVGVFVAACVYAFLLWRIYVIAGPPLAAQVREATDGQVEIDVAQINEAIGISARLALPTLAVYFLIFWLLDRIRPTSWAMRFLALGWGACVSTYVSMIVNSWAGNLMMVQGAGDPAAASRPAVFAAPFVEEVAKASILFLLAILARYRLVSPPQMLSLAGLSAIGFAFTENILYYFRAKVYSSVVASAGDSDQAVRQLALLRGVFTSFGHPVFTTMTGIGLIVALRSRSKWVRIVAPLAGFSCAALGHMLFNGFASIMTDNSQQLYLMIVGWGIVIVLLVTYIRHLLKECRRIRARLGDYAIMGWLTQRDTEVFSHLWWRTKLIWAGAFRGRQVFRGTIRMQRAMTELAYLRDQMTLGVVDAIGDQRAHELIGEIRELRGIGLDEPVGLTIIPRPIFGKWRARIRQRRDMRRGTFAPPTGAPVPVGASFPPPAASQTPWGGAR